MKVTIDMPRVASCEISECAYNIDELCHARAITIGDSVFPGCDTEFSASAHVHDRQQLAGVGACKIAACQYNRDYECGADSISVGRAEGGIRCLTFRTR